MKTSAFLIFIIIALLIYGTINFYIYRRAWMALSDTGIYRNIFLYLFLFLVLAFPLGRFLEPFFRNKITDLLVYIGSFYLGIMVYALLLIIVIDIFRISNNFFHFFPAFITQNLKKTNQWLVLLVASIAFFSILIGHLNALHPRIRTLNIDINKKVNNLDELNIVMMSDIHLGTVIRNSRLVQLVNLVNQLEPDIVLLPGDIVDEDVTPVAEQNMSETLKKIRTKYGVFASTGNHEYIGGIKKTVEYIQKGNIKVLQDEWVKIADTFYIIGRKDMMAQRTSRSREPLSIILNGVDRSLPIILMDHQPFHLSDAEKNGIDLQISGHTHHGQLFPFHLITRLVYEQSWGYSKKGNTHYYVSCGVGTWGPPARTNSVPEIVRIILRFKKEN